MKVGIHSIAFDIPQLYLPITTLAEARNIEADKLIKGLGLLKMSFPDVHQDVVTMASNAALKLIRQENIKPNEISRIYVGTESGVDSSKPVGSYVLSNLESILGEGSFRNCDVVDLTFACIGAVDALQNCLDYIRLNPTKKAIVIASDNAKYDLNSTGEYTQGAGAVAILLKEDPRILILGETVGVGMKSEVDFYKPLRTFQKLQALKDAAALLGVELSDNHLAEKISEAETARAESIAKNPTQLNVDADQSLWSIPGEVLKISRTEPVFDGYFSNECYRARLEEAIDHYKTQVLGWSVASWTTWIFHQPYAYQGRRMAVRFWMDAILRPMIEAGEGADLDSMGLSELQGLTWSDIRENADWEKTIAKSVAYKSFVAAVIAPGERASAQLGNLYTGSVLMSLLSVLADAHERGLVLGGKTAGFFAYGSGSKGKVVEGVFVEGCEKSVAAVSLFGDLASRKVIDFETYVRWHA